MHNIVQGEPLLDERISVSHIEYSGEILRDSDGDYWFEVEPGLFHLGIGKTITLARVDMNRWRNHRRDFAGYDREELKELYSDITFTTIYKPVDRKV